MHYLHYGAIEHSRIPYKLIPTKDKMEHICSIISVRTNIHNAVTRLTSGVVNLREGVDFFYEYMYVLANHEFNPLTVPQSHLRHTRRCDKNHGKPS